MSIQEAETQFYGIFPNAEHNVIKTGITLDVRDASDNKLPLEAYKIVKTYAAAESLIERKVDPSDNTVWYYDAYPGETISVVEDGPNNGLYVVMGTQDPSQNGLTLHRVIYSDDPSSAYALQTRSVDPSTSEVTVTPGTGYYGLSSVTVSAIDSGLDPDLVPGNIKKDVEIFGVTGTYEGSGGTVNNQNKSVNPSTSQQSVTFDSGYTGLGTVTVNAVTSSIDPDIQAGNIRAGVNILGVTGTYDASSAGTTYVHLNNIDAQAQGGPALKQTDVQVGGVNGKLVVDSVTSSDPSWGYGYALDGFVTIYTFGGISNNITEVEYDVQTMMFSTPPSTSGRKICSSTTAPNLTKISFPNLHNTAYIGGWIDPWKDDIELEVNWHAFVPKAGYDTAIPTNNLLNAFGSHLQNLTFVYDYGESYITDTINLYWATALSSASVYNILTKLSPNVSGKYVNFSSSLTVNDYADDRIQTAYDTAVANGWNITGITIVDITPPPTPGGDVSILTKITTNGDTVTLDTIDNYYTVFNINFTANTFVADADGDVLLLHADPGTMPSDNNLLRICYSGETGAGGLNMFGCDTESACSGFDDTGTYNCVAGISLSGNSFVSFDYDNCKECDEYSQPAPEQQGETGNIIMFNSDNSYDFYGMQVYTGITPEQNLNNGTLVHNYMPATYQGQYGIYDTVTDTFYYGDTGGLITGV